MELKKASPFTAVKWEGEQPIVKFENEWYHFEKLDHFSKKEILDFCKIEYGDNWQKRFSEDLVSVLKGLGYQPNLKVSLQLSKNDISQTRTGTFTFENRQLSLHYNKAVKASKFPQKLSIAEALADLRQFEEILKTRSSYAQLSTFDYKTAIRELGTSIVIKKNEVDINEFTNDLGKIMAQIGDRHSSIKNESFNSIGHNTYNLRLPFGIAPIDGKIVATKENSKIRNYTYFYDSHPNIKSINAIDIETLLNSYNYRDKKAPREAKLSRGSRAIQKYGALLYKNNIQCPDSVIVIFTNEATEKTKTFQLTTDKKGYYSQLIQEHSNFREKVGNGNFNSLSNILDSNIGYINIPEMYHYEDLEGLEDYIENTLRSFLDTKALIIDIRNNPGGSRDILKTFARYIVQPEQSPWIANVAYLRADSTIFGDDESMSGRYLYSYNSEELSDNDRNAIDQFDTDFELQKAFDDSKFSNPFYMVLHNGKQQYRHPVYILVNENSFSAATVFTSAFKSLPNVRIVGETTDGSSGNSIKINLKNSNIRVKISTMLSFQRNGKTLDGNGTVPDINIPADKIQVLDGYDNQLSKLIENIN
ncbi:S41 family peptidase [Subsaximicrobium wynnwilliamsii]|uniref:S41 family peptidase n=1 Tax=Subsaximicrobium wynnwilliamsii TaxID=291179 RepID=UPI0016722A46|nr:S41 family peptidase [Subsaximicrobium wynnwilliamsii]